MADSHHKRESIKELKMRIKTLEDALVEKDERIQELMKKNQLLTKLSLRIEERNLELQGLIRELRNKIKKFDKKEE